MDLRLSSVRKYRIKHKFNNLKVTQTIDVVPKSMHTKNYKSKHAQFFLPPLEQHQNNDYLTILRNSIVQTVRKLQDKIFIPHNASKKRNLELVRKRRGSDLKIQKTSKSLSLRQNYAKNQKRMKQISLDEKMNTSQTHRNSIPSCSLQDALYYG